MNATTLWNISRTKDRVEQVSKSRRMINKNGGFRCEEILKKNFVRRESTSFRSEMIGVNERNTT